MQVCLWTLREGFFKHAGRYCFRANGKARDLDVNENGHFIFPIPAPAGLGVFARRVRPGEHGVAEMADAAIKKHVAEVMARP